MNNEFENKCEECNEVFDNSFELVDHTMEDGEEFNPALILPNGVRLMIGSLLRFLYDHANQPEQIRQITQSTYVTLFAAETGASVLDEMIEEMVVNSEMMKFDSTLKTLLEENIPDADEDGA